MVACDGMLMTLSPYCEGIQYEKHGGLKKRDVLKGHWDIFNIPSVSFHPM